MKPSRGPTTRGFARASSLLEKRIRSAGEARGFAVTRLLTHWPEIAGEAVAAVARPVKIGYGGGRGKAAPLGATLTLLTSGAQAPMLQMQLEQIKERVNACYGYRAIAHVRLTQTAPEGFEGFAEAQAPFAGAQKAPAMPPQQAERRAADIAQGTQNTELRLALEALAANVLTKHGPARRGQAADDIDQKDLT
ncbi:DUF721 domain-containing protein [Pseudoroseicyclus aestuarii]|uniref:Uncharacterized protein n=1 Tax=Pseudoroseicyclus aestuarii TaxID=1795041 RepID=A0A318SS39_9RHOB|nr:DUF721 domain-containing protein [Pseudoroseicyclus aestuarii]PYE84640.1 hypothetical protein DFP88_102443 [Pseudoroseicyclus aestuarii]